MIEINKIMDKVGVFTLILLSFFQSCSSSNDAADEKPVNPVPSNLIVQIGAAGKTVDKPDGDGM